MQTVTENYKNVLERIKNAAARSSRDFAPVTPMIVVKYARRQDILTLLSGLPAPIHAAESKLQDAAARWAAADFLKLRPKTVLHFIGQLQKNKISKIVNLFDFIDSVSTAEQARFINAKAAEKNKTVKCMLQVKLTDSLTQAGATLQDAPELIKIIDGLPNIKLCGIMAIAPQESGLLRPVFKSVKKLFDKEFGGREEKYLSLGMSGDFEVAAEEGSTMPRIGSAIFDLEEK